MTALRVVPPLPPRVSARRRALDAAELAVDVAVIAVFAAWAAWVHWSEQRRARRWEP